jgi:hypothetical protein
MRSGNVSPPSDPITVISRACTAPPSNPLRLATMTMADLVTVAWDAPSSGLAASYAIEVGSYFGQSDLARISVSGGMTSMEATAPNSIYVIRVRAQNACGDSAPSNEVVVRVP